MKEEDKYKLAIKALKGNRPVLSDKERLTENIMARIRESSEKLSFQEKLVLYLFGWFNIYWMRGTMAAAALIFAGLFIVQQLFIADRLNKLEKQLVRTEKTINSQEPNLGINQKILLNMVVKNQLLGDSIIVSTADLEELLIHFLELQTDQQDIKQNVGLNPFIEKRIKRSREESDNDDES